MAGIGVYSAKKVKKSPKKAERDLLLTGFVDIF